MPALPVSPALERDEELPYTLTARKANHEQKATQPSTPKHIETTFAPTRSTEETTEATNPQGLFGWLFYATADSSVSVTAVHRVC
jgi:hypothetical protein